MSNILKQQRKYMDKHIDVKPRNEGEIKQDYKPSPLEELQYKIRNSRLYGIYNETKELLNHLPVIGDAMDVNAVVEDVTKGNYGKAAAGAGLLMLPNAIEKPLKRVVKHKYLNPVFKAYEDFNHRAFNVSDYDGHVDNVNKYYDDLSSELSHLDFFGTYSDGVKPKNLDDVMKRINDQIELVRKHEAKNVKIAEEMYNKGY